MSHSRSSSTDSFKSFDTEASPTVPPPEATSISTKSPNASDSPPPFDPTTRLPPTEEAALLASSNTHKVNGNGQFASKDFSSAISTYDKALAELPNYLDFEIAVLRANVAACHLKLTEWKEAVESATKAAERLEVLDPVPKVKRDVDGKGKGEVVDEGEVEEVDDSTADAIERLQQSGHTHDEVQKLRIKVLLRRAKARTELGKWAELQGAEDDYTLLLRMRELAGMERQTAERELRLLRPRLDEAKNREMQEMMGKLKDLGNGLLKPFGMSTDMFQFTKDEKTGGYSMSMGSK